MSNAPAVIRLDSDLHRRVGLFLEESALPSTSAAVRALIELGLTRSKDLQAVWRAVAVKEARAEVSAKVLSGLAEVLNRR